MSQQRLALAGLLLVLTTAIAAARPVKDTPFHQDVSVKLTANAELDGAEFRKFAVNRDGIVYVLTDRGVARLFENTLGLDHSFRPLAGLRPRDITAQSGELFYLYEDHFLANAWAGKVKMRLPPGRFQKFAVAKNGAALLAGPTNMAIARGGGLSELDFPTPNMTEAKLFSWRNEFFVMTDRQVFRLEGRRWKILHEGSDLTTLGFRANEMFVGTKRGFYAVDLTTGRETVARQTRLPVTHITCIVPDTNGAWVGTPRGLFHWSTSGEIRYYASKRWLVDDAVIDIALDRDGSVCALTKGGLSKIAFQRTTLAEKATHYERKIRQRTCVTAFARSCACCGPVTFPVRR